jgi:hemerythrin-like domain-containing protein
MAQNALELLRDDHDIVRDLLSRLVETGAGASNKRQELLKKIGEELRNHTHLEEQVFYPAFREAARKSDQPMVYEAREEHRAVEVVVLPDLEDADPASDEFTGYAKVLKELVEHHAKEEETEMFPRAEELMSPDQLMQLGQRMSELKSSYGS